MIDYPLPFIIATNSRSGSTFFDHLLSCTRKVGYISEYLLDIYSLDYRQKYPDEYPDDVLLSYFKQIYEEKATRIPNPSGLWAIKLHIHQLSVLSQYLEILDVQPNRLKWIWLVRKNKLLQAISFFRARATGKWHLFKGDNEDERVRAREPLDIPASGIIAESFNYYLSDLFWDCFFVENEITPHKVYYEDFIEEDTWEPTVAAVFDFLEIDYKLPLEISINCIKIGTDRREKVYEKIINDFIIKNKNIPVKKDNKYL